MLGVAEVQQRPAHNVVPYYSCHVFGDDCINHPYPEPEMHHRPDMLLKPPERSLHPVCLPLVPPIERNLLTVGDDARRHVPERPLQLLLPHRELAQRPPHPRQEHPRSSQIREHPRRCPQAAHVVRQLAGVDADVEDGLGQVAVQVRERRRELVHVLGQELVRVGDPVVEVGDLVEGEAREVLLVQVPGEPRPEAQRKLVEAQLEKVVDHGNGHHQQREAPEVLIEPARVP
mmetsp:Transcript_2786/g.6579  ORF Transcript_2786/g.6579 Transcript_2786/m.6579 type:complete len:231 (+) Transcript_2786:243-935(+)